LGVAALTSTRLPLISCIEPALNTALTEDSSANVMKLCGEAWCGVRQAEQAHEM
jgi:hypothetical protein